MKSLKLLGIVAFFSALLYIGVEPYAHSVMHPAVPHADYKFKDLEKVSLSGANADHGKEVVMANCTACHSIKSQGKPPMMDDATAAGAYGVAPLDLSNAGAVFDGKFLFNFIKNPAKTALVDHKYNGKDKTYPMPAFGFLPDTDVRDAVAYLQSIASKKMSNKEVFEVACGRCHSVEYDKLPATSPASNLKSYLGKVPPDLSMMIRIKNEEHLKTFIDNPQKYLHGTAMPRVGTTKKATAEIVEYIESIGDAHKEERESLGEKIIVFFLILAGLAYGFMRSIWKDYH